MQHSVIPAIGAALIDELNEQLCELAADLTVAEAGERLAFAAGDDRFDLDVHRRVSVTPTTALRLIEEHSQPGFVVGDIVHAQAADFLARAGWSFWDRRGRLRIWSPDHRYRLDRSGLRSFVIGASGPDPVNPVVGAGGLAVALALLTSEEPASMGVREIARASGMNPSTISRSRSKLIEAALIEPGGTPLPNELFWATSRAWRPKTTKVSVPPGSDWVLAGDAGATRLGAPLFAEHARWYTNDRDAARRLALRHHFESGLDEIAVAPTPIVMSTATGGLAHPIVAALDISTTSRGREILESWTTPAVGNAVWL